MRNASRALHLAWCVLLLTTCRFPGAVQPTLKIGLVAPFEGRYRYVGYDVIYAVRLAIREVNATGGVGGYSVELVAYDDGANPALAVEQARKLAVDPAVLAGIGHFREETTGAALSAYGEAGIPLVAPAVFDPVLSRGEVVALRIGPPAEAVASALLDYLKEMGQGGAALVTKGNSLGMALQRDAQARGVRIFPVVSPDEGAWLAEVLASDVEALFCDAEPVAAGEVIAALRTAGWEGIFLGGPELAATDFAAVAGRAAQGVVFVTPWPLLEDVLDDPDFVDAYAEVSNGLLPGPLAFPAYEAAWTLIEALEQDIAARGQPSRDGISAELSIIEREGFLGQASFGDDGNWDNVVLHWYRIGADGALDHLYSTGSDAMRR